MPGRANLDDRENKLALDNKRDPEGNLRFNKPDGSPSREKVGPADDATRKMMLKGRLEEREPVAKPSTTKPATSIDRDNPTKDITVGTAAKRLRERRLTLQDAEDSAL